MDNNYTIYMSKYISKVPSGIDTQEDVDNAIKYLLSNEN
jgi:CMP-2-keto-3-deoxyoctulosonic acid synthetase